LLSEGTNGIAVAPGTHVAVVAGEFGGAGFGAVRLPASSGSGTPTVVDYVAANIPNDPSGRAWLMGLDPHTLTAYKSPNSGKPIAVITNDIRTFVALVDLEGLLAAPRDPGTHKASLPLPPVVTFVALP
jgi:hypothetical protein